MTQDSSISPDADIKTQGKARPFLDRQEWAGRLSDIADRIDDLRDHAEGFAGTAREWAVKKADAAKQTASEKPVLVVSASAGAALALGLLAGFVIGRAIHDD
jgi:hypothetical protein